jgi:4-amino-4-deoxy-L-arabinose transferase-like glycosyltransferase
MRVRTLAGLTLLLLLGFAFRVSYMTVDRFHADEALYAGWALSILGDDPLLLSAPVDKPPLFLYALAGSFRLFGRSEIAARQVSLASSMLGIALVYRLGKRLYGNSVGVGAACWLALSPFDILFARTAFTDSMLTLWMIAALYAISAERWFVSGLSLGLAFATKQHAILLIPLILATGLVQLTSADPSQRVSLSAVGRALRAIGLGFALPFLAVIAWDAARWSARPGFWEQSAMSYGGLVWAPPSHWAERWMTWLSWARYLAGSPLLAALAILAGLALMVVDWRCFPRRRETRLDTIWLVYALAYIAAHTLLRFSIWDRYLLPLAPLTALLLARAGTAFETARPCPRPLWRDRSRPYVSQWLSRLQVLVICLALLLALYSGYQAARNGYPIGGDHWAYQGLDEIVAYLQEHASPDAVLYHHWLRWHYSYYLHGSTFELKWWQSGEHMRREVERDAAREQYVVLPDWRTLEPESPDLYFELLYQARRRDQSVSLSLYRVSPRREGRISEGAL